MSKETVSNEPKPNSMPEVPELTCPGCIGRDEIIKSLAEKVDEISKSIESIEANKPSEDITNIIKAA